MNAPRTLLPADDDRLVSSPPHPRCAPLALARLKTAGLESSMSL